MFLIGILIISSAFSEIRGKTQNRNAHFIIVSKKTYYFKKNLNSSFRFLSVSCTFASVLET
jgi:hypothetical protein